MAEDAGGVTFRRNWGEAVPPLRDVDGHRTKLSTVLDTMQTSIETLQGISRKKCVGVVWDATDGVAIGAHNIGIEIPDNARIMRSWYEVLVTFTSATDAATISLGLPTDDAAGIVAATAISAGGNIWDAGLHEGIQTGSTANAGEKTTAARQIVATVAVEALTAGKLFFYCEYVVTE